MQSVILVLFAVVVIILFRYKSAIRCKGKDDWCCLKYRRREGGEVRDSGEREEGGGKVDRDG